MGFPVVYSEMLLPTTFLRIALLLGYLRRLIFLAFDAVGLRDLLDVDIPCPEDSGNSQYNYQGHDQQLQYVSSKLSVEEALPVVRYEELAEAGQHAADGDGCAVCLCEFEHGDEVRRMCNCRHVYHRGCLDLWVEQRRLTCPLCRTPLVQGEVQGAVDDHSWNDEEYLSLSSPAPASTLILRDRLFSSS